MEQKEFILCAAIWVNDGEVHEGQPINISIGFVVSGRRHHNCYATIKSIVSSDKTLEAKINTAVNSTYPRKNQGFITSLDRYVDRELAWKIAKENNQIQFGLEASEVDINFIPKSEEIKTSILISEHLY